MNRNQFSVHSEFKFTPVVERAWLLAYHNIQAIVTHMFEVSAQARFHYFLGLIHVHIECL
jgi:hypothetical protein